MRLAIAAIGMFILLFGFARSLQSQVTYDPDKPTASYVLAKLNGQIIADAHTQDRLADFQRRLESLENLNLKDEITQVQQKVDEMYFFLKCIFGGILSLLAKELVGVFKIKKPS